MFCSNLVSILWQLIFMVVPHDSQLFDDWSLGLFGLSRGFTEMYLTFLIPLTIADKNRCFAYELTMAGTLCATVNCFYFIGNGIFAEIIIYMHKQLDWPEALSRFIIVTINIISCIVFFKMAYKEFSKIRKQVVERALLRKRMRHGRQSRNSSSSTSKE